MSGLELRVVAVDPDDPLEGLGDLLANIEKDISSSDLKSLEHRHKSGKWMLKLRVDTKGGKQLPQRRRQALVDLLGVSPAEIRNRMKLAEKYQVSDLGNVLLRFTTWHFICKDALYEKRLQPVAKPKRNTIPVATTARTFTEKLRATPTLTAADRRALRRLADAINQLLDTTASEAPHS
jgi:hypothetical protein